MKSITSLRLTALCALCLAATAAHAGEIISAVGIQDGASGDVGQVFKAAGQTATITTSDVTAQAQTSYGVNRIYNRAAGGMDGESYAGSVWSESFVAQGTGTVHVAFTFTLDGSVDYGALGSGRDFNYILTALAGNWALSSLNGYDDIAASRPFQATQVIGGQPQAFTGETLFALDETGNSWTTQATGTAGTNLERTLTRNGNAFFINTTTDAPYSSVDLALYPSFYTNSTIANGAPRPYVTNPGLLQSYNAFRTNFAVLGQASLCQDTVGADDYGCLSGNIAPTPLTLEFDIAAGSTFTLFSSLTSEDAEDGVVDFFHTVRLTDVVATGGTLSSSNALFQATGNGRYGFANAELAAVPEPSTWAMLVAGFGLIGGAMRRKHGAGQRAVARA